jgi:hypothetical protein
MDLEKECARLKAKDVKDRIKIRNAALNEAAQAVLECVSNSWVAQGAASRIRALKTKVAP